MKEKNSNKKVILAAVILLAFVAAAAILYFTFGPKPVKGSKEITVTVVDDQGQETKYEIRTDAEYLQQALEEIKALKIEGTEGEYGMYIDTVNGVTADYSADGAYWALYLNDGYCQYSINQQPVNDGDAFKIKYEIGME